MKAQAAVEYLTTYGWMLVALAVAAGVIFSILGDQCPRTVSGFTGDDVAVTDYGITSDYDLGLVLANRKGYEVTVEEISIMGGEIELDEEIDPGSRKNLQISGFKEGNQCNTLNLTLTYSGGGLTSQKTTGTVTGFIATGDAPPAPTDMEAVYTGS